MAQTKQSSIPYLISGICAVATLAILARVVVEEIRTPLGTSFTGPGTITVYLEAGRNYDIKVLSKSGLRSFGEIVFNARVTHVDTGTVVPTTVFAHELAAFVDADGLMSYGLLLSIKQSGDYRIQMSYPPGKTGPTRGVGFGEYMTTGEVLAFYLKTGSSIIVLGSMAIMIGGITWYGRWKAKEV